MVRAVVLIGVSRAGNLEPLQAVFPGIRAMQRWAAGQGIAPSRIKVLTDEDAPLAVSSVKKAIRELVDLTTVEQLIVYFAGHGVNLSLSEYWLLSDAPGDTNEAVNVTSSMALARFCGIPHVVFLSDACRTAAEGIQAQAVRGSEIFPNIPDAANQGRVDVFYACALGAPALEVKDPKKAAAGFKAVFTESLVEALEGRHDVVVEDPEDGTPLKLLDALPDSKDLAVVRAWPLFYWLRDDVLRRLEKLSGKPGLNQTPDSLINSRNRWLAEVPLPAPGGKKRRGRTAAPPARGAPEGVRPEAPSAPAARPAPRTRGPAAPPARGRPRFGLAPPPAAPPPGGPVPASERPATRTPSPPEVTRPARTLFEDSRALLRQAMSAQPVLRPDAGFAAGRKSVLIEPAARIAAPFGPARVGTGTGFKIRGRRFASASAATGAARVGGSRETVTVDGFDGPAVNVVLGLEGGNGLVLPALTGFVAALTVEEGELVNVTYEPAEGSPRREQMTGRLDELRNLRAVLASSARMGVLHLRRGDAGELAGAVRAGGGVDPTIALYAAYALWDRQETELLEDVASAVERDLGCGLFDLALLAGRLRGSAPSRTVPFLPVLSRGWPLLAAHRSDLPVAGELSPHRVESLWTLYDAEGFELLKDALEKEAP